MKNTRKAHTLRVGDTVLVAHMPIGTLSLTTGKFKRDEGGGYDEECLIVGVKATTEDGWPPSVPGEKFDANSWGPQPVVMVIYVGDNEKERGTTFDPDDDVRVKEATR